MRALWGPTIQLSATVGLAVLAWSDAPAHTVAALLVALALLGMHVSWLHSQATSRVLDLQRRQIERLRSRLTERDDSLEAAQLALQQAALRTPPVATVPDSQPMRLLTKYRDTMTDVPNRLWFEQFVRHLSAEPSQQKCEIVLVELQQVAGTISSNGAQAGEVLLRTVAQRLRNELRNSDCIARVGNVTFALALETRVGSEQAIDIARRLVLHACKPIVLPDGGLIMPAASHKHVTTRDAAQLPDDAQSVTERTVVRARRSARGDLSG